MDTLSFSGYTSNNSDNHLTTEIKTSNNAVKAGVLALGIILSSNQMPVDSTFITSNTSFLTCIDGTISARGVYSNISRYNYAERYKVIARSEWFRNAYKNKSLGEIVGIDI